MFGGFPARFAGMKSRGIITSDKYNYVNLIVEEGKHARCVRALPQVVQNLRQSSLHRVLARIELFILKIVQ
jgi:hypothetical protein